MDDSEYEKLCHMDDSEYEKLCHRAQTFSEQIQVEQLLILRKIHSLIEAGDVAGDIASKSDVENLMPDMEKVNTPQDPKGPYHFQADVADMDARTVLTLLEFVLRYGYLYNRGALEKLPMALRDLAIAGPPEGEDEEDLRVL